MFRYILTELRLTQLQRNLGGSYEVRPEYMTKVLEFPKQEELLVWSCIACGAVEFMLWSNGEVTCAECEALMGDMRCYQPNEET